MRASTTPLRRVTAILALLALAACGRTQAPTEPVRVVRSEVVAAASASGSQDYAAEVRARTELRLGFRVGGKLNSRPAEVGKRVRAGELLASLDPQDLKLAHDAARAAVQTAQVNLDLVRADFARFKDLRDQGFISAAELDRREASVRAATAQVEQAKAQAAVQGNQAGYSTLVAPGPGVVLATEAEVGHVVAAGQSVVRVALDGPRDVVFAVPEDSLAAMRALQGRAGALVVRLWSAKDQRLAATVREVAAAADPVTRTYAVKAEVAGAALPLGQTATVSIERPRAEARIAVPMTAVREHRGGSAVWVVDANAGVVRLRPVELGDVTGEAVGVRSGLQPGERVVTAGVHVLTEGQKVRLPQAVPAAASTPASAAR